MNEISMDTWPEANQRCLTAAIARVREALELHAAPAGASPPEGDSEAAPAGELQAAATALLPAPSALETLCRSFELSDFERDVLLLCAGVELEASFAALCAAAQGDPQLRRPTFGLALAALPEAHWSALLPAAALRRWRLVEVGSGDSLATSSLRIDERILHYLTGLRYLDEHLIGFVEPLAAAADDLVPSHQRVAEAMAAVWSRDDGIPPLAQLTGRDDSARRQVAVAAAAEVGLQLYRLPAQVLPTGPVELDILVRLWEREAVLGRGALLVEADGMDEAGENRLIRFLETTGGALILSGRERRHLCHRGVVLFDVDKPTAAEQRELWQRTIGETASLNGHVERLCSHFDLSAPAIRAACWQARDAASEDAPPLEKRLWSACRAQARPRLGNLAQRIAPAATWDDIVLPDEQLRIMREIAVHVRNRATVYETWGFAAKSARGLGLSALFSGPSGTGKTMASEVLANDLGLDLYHIDLSSIVSKYIGETEKNLSRVFDAAEEGGAVLLFDEADALFGKRSEVKDSHDRYANIEVSYLLQRMESYRGLAILTTNLKEALDEAFLRRLRFMVTFQFPGIEQRERIWRRIFPARTPTEGLDFVKLARLNATGGSIRNIAMNAAFLAADADQPVRTAHLLEAARSEFAKLERPLTDVEIRGWI